MYFNLFQDLVCLRTPGFATNVTTTTASIHFNLSMVCSRLFNEALSEARVDGKAGHWPRKIKMSSTPPTARKEEERKSDKEGFHIPRSPRKSPFLIPSPIPCRRTRTTSQ